ncbi:hypothetical protein GYMLUDRAFT_49490 [Collybiopsis luxurians FD-317 M1]|uniref:Uncharacterized protein n=1 Tax=Collybiopsis luxurians FD-317 M1 TaxID=944289 RepID=A0A0D0BU57_9AGAR|nr:hypothetical protein GYMLUDRAFT_49490 [Collybiopsis luxurians FD-317 M1]
MSAPPGLLLLMDSPLTAMHSILGCRLVLHVREVAARGTGDIEDDDDDDLLPTFIITIIEPYMSSKIPQYYV